jgi:hypothetical protein
MKTAVGEVQGEALTLVNTTNTAIAAESGSAGTGHPLYAGPDGKGHLRGGGRPAGGR